MENLSEWKITRQDSSQMELQYEGIAAGGFLIFIAVVTLAFLFPELCRQISTGFILINEVTLWAFGACAALLAGLYSFHSTGTAILDSSTMTMRICRRKLFFRSDDERSLKDAREILYFSEWRSGSKSRHQYWFVELVMSDGEKIRLGNLVEGETQMRARAERFAKFLRLPLHDKTGEVEKVIPDNELDLPLSKKMDMEPDNSVDITNPPPGSGIEAGRNDRAIRFFLPPSRHGTFIFVFCLLWGGSSLIFFFNMLSATITQMMQGNQPPPPVLVLMSIVFACIGVFMIFGSYKGLSDREEVIVTTDAVEKAVLNKGRRTAVEGIAIDKIEDIRLTDSSGASREHGCYGVSIVSDERIIKVGRSLNPGETEWLSNALRQAVCEKGQDALN